MQPSLPFDEPVVITRRADGAIEARWDGLCFVHGNWPMFLWFEVQWPRLPRQGWRVRA